MLKILQNFDQTFHLFTFEKITNIREKVVTYPRENVSKHISFREHVRKYNRLPLKRRQTLQTLLKHYQASEKTPANTTILHENARKHRKPL